MYNDAKGNLDQTFEFDRIDKSQNMLQSPIYNFFALILFGIFDFILINEFLNQIKDHDIRIQFEILPFILLVTIFMFLSIKIVLEAFISRKSPNRVIFTSKSVMVYRDEKLLREFNSYSVNKITLFKAKISRKSQKQTEFASNSQTPYIFDLGFTKNKKRTIKMSRFFLVNKSNSKDTLESFTKFTFQPNLPYQISIKERVNRREKYFVIILLFFCLISASIISIINLIFT
ncbi:hypothetical protein NEF87_004067 [Candidatus Lokiarchaeum ossiferum]|uniref:PH domain-containing protein n=1 Tax=Candidatus Lokiarchaeum ossiferum TaxID=2951803 RepID=A0ABY6HZL3_9ARCH|nr:hypothetical protein NEF87_004067 [Candidatus Lokiarchaeum sp. B-35]